MARELEDTYTAAGLLVGAAWSPYVSATILANAPRCAETIAAVAEANPRVKAMVERFLATSVAAQVIGAHFPIVLACVHVARHGEPTAEDLAAAQAGTAGHGGASAAAGPSPFPGGFGGFAAPAGGADLGEMLGQLNDLARATGYTVPPPSANGSTSAPAS